MAGSTPPPATTSSAEGGDLDPNTRFTPLATSVLTPPMPVEGTDEKVHLTYDILITNATSLPVQLDRLEVSDADSDDPLLAEEGPQLNRSVTRLGASADGTDSTDPLLIGPAETWVAWVDVQLGADADIPKTLELAASGAIIRPEGEPAEFSSAIGTTAVDDRAAPVVGVPVQDGIWYMSEGCCADSTHHRRGLAPINGQALVPQRYAIDFYLLDEEHRTWEGEPSQLSSYFSYQQPIVAAASGTVVRAVDGIPNTTSLPGPPPIPPIEHTVGNHVVVEIEPGIFALYGHMDPGSVRVRVGDDVEQGQELGLIGSSGNSTTPHLHFHLQTEPTFFPSDGMPYVFDEFELLGHITERIWDDNVGLEPTGELPFEGVDASIRHDELPLDRTVVRVSRDEGSR
ncbi:M23 family metallopeptidase [Agromyces ramosus]|uniref:M23ase beta-sheet core domain-containing protein n=1 Tax=Agromyces ramosus TaxID=33879 RepID=A0ABU0R6G8_9MICO|nr:M23 family metallopeptidase [Agromyces ramosus]MDQ0892766.1 hypothetical protein [Agromyces ramosus]